LRERGFNQALLLVRELNRSTRIPYSKKLLRKKILTPPQVHLSRAEREKAVRGSFDLQREEEVEGKLILLVDDVYTTGSTVNECARVLRKAGAKQIDVLTLAHAIKNF
jgi:ComF family protein